MALDFPNSPTNGQKFGEWQWDGTKWVSVASGTSVTISDPPPPSSPSAGNLWWNSAEGNLYIYYSDPNSSQWIVANPNAASQAMPKGVTDGSNAAAGQVGEFQSILGTAQSLTSGGWTTLATVSLTPGDWDLWGEVSTSPSAPNIQVQAAGWSTAQNSAPNIGMTMSIGGPATFDGLNFSITPRRVSSASTTTMYLVGTAVFPSGTCTATGNWYARRVR